MNESVYALIDGAWSVVERAAAHRDRLLHMSAHLLCYNDRGLYLQRRPPTRTTNPDAWTSTVSGHITTDDGAIPDVDVARLALSREVVEELGFAPPLGDAEFFATVREISEGADEVCVCDAFLFRLRVDDLPAIATEEVAEVRLFALAEIASGFARGLAGHPVAPNFAPIFEAFRNASR